MVQTRRDPPPDALVRTTEGSSASSAASISLAERYREPGSFERHRAMTIWSPVGTRALKGFGLSFTIAVASSAIEAPSKGSLPEAIS